MKKELPDFNELCASLAKRDVSVVIKGRYTHAHERMSYSAKVSLNTWSVLQS